MRLSSDEMLRRLGAGRSIDSVCADAGISRAQFDAWWQQELTARLPECAGDVRAAAPGRVDILRDRWGVPHVYGDTDPALFFGFGFAMAQDRLWQMDYLRRRAHGRLAEILGTGGLSLDVVSRTVGITRIARRHLDAMPTETTTLLEHFSKGVNASIKHRKQLPIEFGLLDYSPEPWAPLDSIAILGEFRWYLTGRLFVIAFPEIAKRTLGNDELYRAFLTPEAGLESIVSPESYTSSAKRGDRTGREAIAGGAGVGDEGGSNNWAVGVSRSATGKPLVSSDPHIAFGSTSCWHEIRLTGGSFDCVGMSYVGVPAMIMGRNRRVAWGITNNICSQRDLYQERTDPAHPGAFLYDGQWEPAHEVIEKVQVRDGAPVELTVRSSRNGPIVDELLPEPARGTGPVSLRWVGAEQCDEISSALAASRAGHRRRVSRGVARVAVSDLELRVRGRRRPYRLSVRGPNPDSRQLGPRISARMESRASMARVHTVRRPARGDGSPIGMGEVGEQPSGAARVSVSAVEHVRQRPPRATHPANAGSAGTLLG